MVVPRLPTSESLSTADPWLEPYHQNLQGRLDHVAAYARKLYGNDHVDDFANGHEYFGLHRTNDGWILREWAPAATKIYLQGEFSQWRDDDSFAFSSIGDGNWELQLPASALKHGDAYKLHMYWDGGDGDRVPAWARYVVQDPKTQLFSAIVWNPARPRTWHDAGFVAVDEPPLIYEAHVGMSSDKETVSTYLEFAENVIPRIKAADTIPCS